jgi:hypothetical protein
VVIRAELKAPWSIDHGGYVLTGAEVMSAIQGIILQLIKGKCLR